MSIGVDMLDRIIKKIVHEFYSSTEKKQYVTRNLNLDLTRKQERTLFCYLDYDEASERINSGATHTNQPRFFQMLKCLYDLDMVVDVCACNELNVIQELDFSCYDYVIGFGKVFQIACQRALYAKKIIYMTEDPYYVAQKKEEERIEYFIERHPGKKYEQELRQISNVRAGHFYLPDQEKNADIIICQGNESYFAGLKGKIYPIVPNAFRNTAFINNQELKEDKSFLMFGASGLVRKGIDILIDVFMNHPDWKLYLCDREISKKLERLGFHNLPSNVVDCGFVDIGGSKAVELFSKCRFIILPSCTEAPSSAVLTGMRHGLIPVVTAGIGLDRFSEFCFYFRDYHIPHIESVLEEVCKINSEELANRSKRIFKYANEHFTLGSFTSQFKTIMLDIKNEAQ